MSVPVTIWMVMFGLLQRSSRRCSRNKSLDERDELLARVDGDDRQSRADRGHDVARTKGLVMGDREWIGRAAVVIG